MRNILYPLYLKPAYQSYIWGGQKLADYFHREVDQATVAESWEISDRSEGMSVVVNGSAQGQTLEQLIADHGAELLGTNCPTECFPLLIKILDAHKRLSVQVHPDDEGAAEFGGEAKTEMWYVLQASPGAKVYCGFKEGVTSAQYAQAVQDGSTADLLAEYEVGGEDAVFVPGGRVHAIGAGCLMLEVQQNSNTTYRIDDWGRVGADGEPRELHTEQAAEVIDFDDPTPVICKPHIVSHEGDNEIWEVHRGPYFVMERLMLGWPFDVNMNGHTFHVLFCVVGEATIKAGEETLHLVEGMSCLIPAGCKKYHVTLMTEKVELLRVFLPER